jgi:uncharacterized Zn-binding protein involved in type VI secretion
MGQQVVTGAMIACTFGMAPSSLIATSAPTTMVGGPPAATIMDCAPIANIPPFGMCQSLSNPAVVSATAAALGVLTPMPCVPVTTPWTPGSPTVTIGGFPALNNTSQCMCSWLGVITVGMPGQMTTEIA